MSEGKTFGQADVRQALDGLSANVKGCWSMEEHELRQLLVNTNYNVIQHWLEQANGALAAAPEPPSPSPELKARLDLQALLTRALIRLEAWGPSDDPLATDIRKALNISDEIPE
jgi:hypothetical protein